MTKPLSGRRAKIVCTIGPASSSPDCLKALIEAGMDVARLNFSHGTHADHGRVIAEVRRLSEELGRPVAVLQDLQGPKIRIGRLAGGQLELVAGQRFTLTAEEIEGDGRRASVSYPHLRDDLRPGDPVLLNDGLLRLEVVRVEACQVECVVVEGGLLRERAGVNLPGAALKLPSVTDKDRADLAFGLAQGVELVALSFVRQARDLVELQELVAGVQTPPALIAKLEKPQAIEALDEILEIADGVMVARGDLGVELSPERVPFIQKTIIRKATQAWVPVITATQMLESMIEHPRPTRAEASDVANAVFDGTDAVMLSGETSIGRHPLLTVRMMDRIVREAERNAPLLPERPRLPRQSPAAFPDAIAEAAVRVAAELKATAIVAFTKSGFTARLISKYHPTAPIVVFTPHEHIFHRLCLYWGVQARLAPFLDDTDEMVAYAATALQREGLVAPGDRLVFLAGRPSGQRGTTNLLHLHRIGDPVA